MKSFFSFVWTLVRGIFMGLAFVMFMPCVGFALVGWALAKLVWRGLKGAYSYALAS